MKRAFDANVSKSRPRTRTTAMAEESEPLSADLAAVLVRPRAKLRGGNDAQMARAIAEAAGAAASSVARTREEPRPSRDGLSHREEELAALAGQVAHRAVPDAEAERAARKARIAQAMRFTAARAAEAASAAAEATPAQTELPVAKAAAQPAARTATEQPARASAEPAWAMASAEPPAWLARAALPAEEIGDDDVLDASPLGGAPTVFTASARQAGTPTLFAQSAPPSGTPTLFTSSDPVGIAREVLPALEARPAMKVRTVVLEETQTVAQARPRQPAPAEETVAEGRSRIAELRSRLAASTRPRVTASEVVPAAAAHAVRQAVEELRARLGVALGERDALAKALDSTRDDLAKANQTLVARAKSLEAAEDLARERAQVAEELAAEAEALAEERDQALARILELKSLDEQQTRLLAEADEALGERERQLAEAEASARELIAALDVRAAEVEELTACLAERTRERDELADRVARLEAELQALFGTREALAEIQRLVTTSP